MLSSKLESKPHQDDAKNSLEERRELIQKKYLNEKDENKAQAQAPFYNILNAKGKMGLLKNVMNDLKPGKILEK